MRKEVIEIEVKTDKAIQGVKKLDDSVKEVTKDTKDVGAASKEVSGGLDRMTGGAISKFKGMLASIKAVNGGFGAMKIAIIGTGIGALLIAIIAVGKAFTNTEAGQNKFAKLMGVIGSVTGNLVDILASLGEKIISVFENPKQAINDFVKLLKDNVITRFEGLLELVPALGKAMKQMFELDFTGAAATAGNAVAKVALGTDNLTESIKKTAAELKKIAKEIKDDAISAAAIADKRAQATKIERSLTVERAKADQKIADLRFKSEQREKFSAGERVKFLKEASALADEITEKEIAANKLRLDAQIAENKLAGSKTADLQAVADLEAKGIQLNTSKLTLQKRLVTSIISFQNEEKAGIKAIADERAKYNVLGQTQEEYDAIAKRNEELNKFEDELQKAEIERAQKGNEAIKAIEDEKFANDMQREDERLEILQRNSDAATKIAQIEAQAKNEALQLYANGLAVISDLVGKETGAGKALSVASTLISTYLSAQKAYESQLSIPTPDAPIRAALAAGVAVASGLANVKAILSVKVPNSGASQGVAAGASQAKAPQFNVVGSSGTNQLASAIGGQSQKPIKTYVVANEVVTQAAMDRSIVNAATFGG